MGGSRLARKPARSAGAGRAGRLTAKQKLLTAIAVVLAVVLAAVLAWRSLFVRPDPANKRGGGKGGDAAPAEEIDYGEGIRPRADGERKSEDYYTVLILGRDTAGGGNTDTMLLASYDVTNQKAAVMSIPRDTMVNVSWDVKKINSVYNSYGGGDRGIQALYREVSQLVGFEPDYKVVVEWEAVGRIVDAIGGVYFDVPIHMDYHDPTQDLVIEQVPGYRRLTGDDAMQVVRWRSNDNDSPFGYRREDGGIGDDGRMKLQQDFLKAALSQMMTIQNVGNINKIVKVFEDCVETDLSFQEIFWFARKALLGGLKMEDVEFFTMPWRGTYAWSRSYQQNLAYVVPMPNQILEIVNTKLSPFTETFTLRDLDIMSVNADGSLSSSTGYVEDRKAALPPEIPADGPGDEPAVDPATGEPITGPDTGEPGGAGVIEVPPESGAESGDQTPPGTDDPVSPPEDGAPDQPSGEWWGWDPVQTEPDVPGEPDFSFIDPPPAE